MLAEYIQYFRDFAIGHPQIKHVAAAESDDYPTPGDRRFTLFNMEQVAKAAKSAMWEGPALHLHLYDRRTGGSTRGSMRYTYVAGLLITQKVHNSDITSQVQACEVCEGIVNDFIDKLQADSIAGIDDCSFVFKDIFWDQMDINPVGPLFDNRYGWWVQFSFLKNG